MQLSLHMHEEKQRRGCEIQQGQFRCLMQRAAWESIKLLVSSTKANKAGMVCVGVVILQWSQRLTSGNI